MKNMLALLMLLALPAFAQTTVQVPPGTQSITLTFNPVAVPPPTCGALPSPLTQVAQCPAGSKGSYPQTATYSAAPPPTCAVLGAYTPTTPPAGACIAVTPPPVTANCGMQKGGPAAFCYTFDMAMPIAGTRSGGLDPNGWGVSRTGGVNFGQGQLNLWNATVIQNCDGTTSTVTPPNDVTVCNGQLREASNDNNSLQFEAGGVTSLAIYPKQPFDFAGRTGTVSFDVSNDTAGFHAAWPEFWMTDAPVPGPFTHFGSWEALPQNGFAVRFANEAEVGQLGLCPNANNLTQLRWTVDSAAIIRNYTLEDSEGYGASTGLKVILLDCVIESTGPGSMNHIELQVAQNTIDVYASDAGAIALRHIASITGANLTFTRGLVWLEDVHYNADKGDPLRPTQRQHTFTWDNLAFDGPFTDRDFAYDAPDNNAPGPNGAVNLGVGASANQLTSWNIPGVPANPPAAAVKVLFNFNGGGTPNPTTINVLVNGHAHPTPWPYPDSLGNTWRTLAVVANLSDLVAGTNVVQIGGDQPLAVANVDLVLAGVAGGVAVLPGSDNAYP